MEMIEFRQKLYQLSYTAKLQKSEVIYYSY